MRRQRRIDRQPTAQPVLQNILGSAARRGRVAGGLCRIITGRCGTTYDELVQKPVGRLGATALGQPMSQLVQWTANGCEFAAADARRRWILLMATRTKRGLEKIRRKTNTRRTWMSKVAVWTFPKAFYARRARDHKAFIAGVILRGWKRFGEGLLGWVCRLCYIKPILYRNGD